MTITVTNSALVYLDPVQGQIPFQTGNDITNSYYNITLSDGTNFNVPMWWDTATVQNEINISMAAAQARADNAAAMVAAAQALINSLSSS
jgi:hypothetical protein